MAVRLTEIVRELDAMLDAPSFDDWCPNGLQVEGRPEVARVVSGVSAHLKLFERAAELEADALLVHHGLFWRGDPQPVTGPLRARLRLLLDAEISLLAYHLPLDAHPRLGNNVLLAAAIGAEPGGPFAHHRQRPIGCVGRFVDGRSLVELVEQVNRVTQRAALVFDYGPATIHSVGICSGAGTDYIAEAAAAGLDALLTGEPAERSMAQAREAGIHLLAAGHHATERLGVRALGEHLAAHHGIEHLFIDVPNPV